MTESELYEKYIGLIKRLAYKKCRPHLFDDLVQEGCYSLIKSFRKYNKLEKKPCSFITYTYVYINKYMYKYVEQNSRSVTVPSHYFCSKGYSKKGLVQDADLYTGIKSNLNIQEEVERKILLEDIREEIASLSKFEQDIVQGIYGFDSEELFIEEIVRKQNTYRLKVSRTKKKVIEKLSKKLVKRGYSLHYIV